MTDELTESVSDLVDIRDMQLDLDKGQKLRAAALMLGIRYYTDTIIKDPEYLKTMIAREKEMKFSNEPDAALWHLRPATVMSVIRCAQEFEQFLLGNRSAIQSISVDDEEVGPGDVERAQGSTQESR